MRPEPNHELDQFRQCHPLLGDSPSGMNHGYFVRGPLRLISSGTPQGPKDSCFSDWQWEHVSVSKSNRKMPTWEEMCLVKAMFWDPEELVIQFHPPESEYVNHVDNCLHLWKPLGQKITLPPNGMV